MAQRQPPAGLCYELAGRHVLKTKKGSLVHGKITTVSGVIGHAWVETNSKVYDPCAGVTVSKKEYYEFASAVPERKYTAHEAMLLAVKTGHWGPWHTNPECVCFCQP